MTGEKMLDLPGLEKNVRLAPYTTYQIGGPADLFVEVFSAEELVAAVKAARIEKIPYFVLGTGANILITDKGFRGLVIRNLATRIEFLSGNKVRAESGVTIAKLIEKTRDAGLSGLEHFVGIPSSVGGAIWQNLHFLAPDRKSTLYIEGVLDSAKILNDKDEVLAVDPNFFQFGYDDSILHHQEVIVLEVTFQLTPKSSEEIQRQMDANQAWRNEKQPQLDEFASCGSVFKKIEGVGAGRLIDQAGLKGTRIGQAEISEKHANYIVNLGGASAKDVLDLIKLAQEKVREKTGYQIEPEIRVVGEV
jgi:UDP-N-acetylmuramate dehydrogenase